MSAIVRAVIFIPTDIAHGGLFARQGIDYLGRRGYALAGVLRVWSDVLRALAGDTSIVVFVRREHRDPAWDGTRAEFVDEETRRLPPVPRRALDRKARERYGTVNISAQRAREVMDGTGPVPDGLDAESVAAARRIARALANGRYA